MVSRCAFIPTRVADGNDPPQKSMFPSMSCSIPRCQNTRHTNP